ncbi:hypothetical protein [Arthrobacter sp. Z1-15]
MSTENTQRDELALDIFLADNNSIPEETLLMDWADAPDQHRPYAQNIAAGLIAKGYRKLDPADETAIDKVAATLAKSDGWLSLAHPSPRHQTLLRERARAILTTLAEPEAESIR